MTSGTSSFPSFPCKLVALACVTSLALGVLQAAAQTTVVGESALLQLSLPAQPLAQTLSALARQSGLAIGGDASLLVGKTAPALQGSLSLQQALERVLAGSGLTAVRSGNAAMSIQRLAESTTALPAVTVTANAEQEAALGPVNGFVAKRSASATKTDTPIIETPQSIAVVTADQITAQGAKTLRDAIGYTAGVGSQTSGYRDTDNLVLRGFVIDNSSIRRDGLRLPANTFTGTQEPYGLERAEVLRGAASLLYGASEPGGIINLVSKRPTSDSLREVGLETGSHQRKQATADLGGALNQDGSLSYRLTLLGRNSGSFIDDVPDNRVYIAPAISWKSATTQLTLLSHYQDTKINRQWGVPPDGSLLDNPNGRIPRNRNIGEPTDHREDTHKAVDLLLEHALSDQTQFNFSLQRSQVDLAWDYSGRGDLQPDQRTLTRYGASRVEKVSAWTLDSHLQTRFSTGAWAHQLVLGVDGSNAKNQRTRVYSFVDPLDLYQPVYGAQPYGSDGEDGYKARQNAVGLYLQDQIKIDSRWVLLLGARHDQVKTTQTDYFVEDWATDRSRATTGRAGLVYLADNGLAPFISASQSFEPVADKDRLGNRFKPTKGVQYEAGVRWQPPGSNTLLSASVYQLTQRNVQVTDPVDPDNFSIQVGAVRSRGLELEAKADIGRNLRLITAYTYTDARTTKASPVDPASVGARQPNTPYNQLSAWADYQFGAWGLPGLRLGAGMRYVGATLAANAPYTVPGYTVWDAGASYEHQGWKYALNLKNLADRNYIAECGNGYCNYGDPRQVLLSVQYRW